MFFDQHYDFLKTLLMGLSHCIALRNGFFQEFPYFCEGECILALAY